MVFLQNSFKSPAPLHVFSVVTGKRRMWVYVVRSHRSRGRETVGGQEHSALGLSFVMSQNLMNAHSHHSRFPIQRRDSTDFRSRDIMQIIKKKKKKKGIKSCMTQALRLTEFKRRLTASCGCAVAPLSYRSDSSKISHLQTYFCDDST